MNGACEIPHLDITISQDRLVEGALEIATILRPLWPHDKIQTTVFKNGITNKLVGVFLPSNEKETILIRVYGEKTEQIIDRHVEIYNIKVLQVEGLAPQLFATFHNGLCYSYFEGSTLSVEAVRDPILCPLIASRLARFHNFKPDAQINGREPVVPVLWEKLAKFLAMVPETYSDNVKQSKFVTHVPSKALLFAELRRLETKLSQLGSPVVFCHNDLLLNNIIHNAKDGSVEFIDFEYAGFNYQAFDIANHFCEFAGVDDVDYNRFPDAGFQREWLRNYLKAFLAQDDVDHHIEAVFSQVEHFVQASHFFWGVWALVQAANSAIDFDFLSYGILRLQEYKKWNM